MIDDLFRYSYNTSHGEVLFLVYNILDAAWSPWSPEREQMPIINKDNRVQKRPMSCSDKNISISSKLRLMLTCSMGKIPGMPSTDYIVISSQKSKLQQEGTV